MFSCKCLNIIIHSENNDIQKVESDVFQLKDSNANDTFFKKEIGQVISKNVSIEHTGLVSTRNVDSWIIHKCLNCLMDTHAVHKNKDVNYLFVTNELVCGPSNVSALQYSEDYSQTFRVIIHSESDEQLELSKNAVSQFPSEVQTILSNLQQQLIETIRKEVAATEKRVRRYTELQYAALENLRKQAHKEHNALVRLILKSQSVEQIKVSNSEEEKNHVMDKMDSVEPTPKIVSKPKHPSVTNLSKSKKNVVRQLESSNRTESIDAEVLFPLDGVEENSVAHSDVEESDTDDSASHDEGIHIPRQRAQTNSMAKSLPMNIPVFMSAYSHEVVEDKVDNKVKEDSVDIAASIKALAKSVHGDAVFGELPRPRLSTLI